MLESQIEMFEQKQLEIKNNINLLTSEIKQIEDKILYNNMMKEEFSTRLSYVTKMTTIATRDFRGFLLSNIIEYIDSCAKNYARYIFDNDKISLHYQEIIWTSVMTEKFTKVYLVAKSRRLTL